MFPRKYRLRKKRDFEKVFKEGDAYFGRFFMVRMKRNELPFSRFAFVFPVKQEKRATRRNRGKRLFREATRQLSPFVKRGFDIIFIIKKEALGEHFEDIKRETEKLLKKAGILQITSGKGSKN